MKMGADSSIDLGSSNPVVSFSCFCRQICLDDFREQYLTITSFQDHLNDAIRPLIMRLPHLFNTTSLKFSNAPV